METPGNNIFRAFFYPIYQFFIVIKGWIALFLEKYLLFIIYTCIREQVPISQYSVAFKSGIEKGPAFH